MLTAQDLHAIEKLIFASHDKLSLQISSSENRLLSKITDVENDLLVFKKSVKKQFKLVWEELREIRGALNYATEYFETHIFAIKKKLDM